MSLNLSTKMRTDMIGGICMPAQLPSQTVGRIFVKKWRPCFANEAAQNLSTSDLDHVGRAGLEQGDMKTGVFEISDANRLAQHDSALAAAADNDDSFQIFVSSAMSGIKYLFRRNLALQISSFAERREQTAKNINRALFDLTANW